MNKRAIALLRVSSRPQEMSRQRADISRLEKKFGLQAARLEVVGVGTKNLIVATPPQTPEPRNRGVKVVNLGA